MFHWSISNFDSFLYFQFRILPLLMWRTRSDCGVRFRRWLFYCSLFWVAQRQPYQRPPGMSRKCWKLSPKESNSRWLFHTVFPLNWSSTLQPQKHIWIRNTCLCITFHIFVVFQKGHQKKDEVVLDIQVLQDTYLSLVSSFQGLEINPSVNKVLTTFRDMCSITWMLYARDKLSISLRKKAALAEKRVRNNLILYP